ncbi:MAG TPA: hypothetical protein VGD62_01425, partial [Acidobacteriaceae bacterium]
SAFGHATQASALFQKHDYQGALAAAQQSVQTNRNSLQGQVILGDTLAALHRDREAAAAYDQGLAIAARMEPSARADWEWTVGNKRRSLHL